MTSFVLALSLLSSIPHWDTHGPPFPIVDALVVAPDGTIYAAARETADGPSAAFRSLDGGLNWTLLARAPEGETIRQLAVDPTGPYRVIAVTESEQRRSKLYRTADAGLSWRFDFEDAYYGQNYQVFFDPTRPDLAYLVGSGLFRSEHSGPWETMPGYLGFGYYFSSPRAWITRDGKLLWVTGACILVTVGGRCVHWTTVTYLSTDAGETTNEVSTPVCDPRFVVFAQPALAYSSSRFCADLMRSEDGGVTWARYDPSGDLAALLDGTNRYVSQLAVVHGSPGTIYALALDAAGEDGVVLWTRDSAQSWELLPGTPPVSVTAISVDASGALLLGTTGGVFRQGRGTRAVEPRD